MLILCMKILVTGANGLLGQKLVAKLVDQPHHQLLATGRGVWRGENIPGLRYQSLDIEDRQAVFDLLQKEQPNTIIHAAAMTQVDLCETEQEACQRANVDAVQHICDACQKLGIYLVHVSTDFIFDGEGGPYDEAAQPEPISVYGRSKWEGEKVVMQLEQPWCIIRTALVYGLTHRMSRSNIVLWAHQSLKEKKEIRVVDDQFRSPTLAEDLADACIAAAQRQPCGVFHISGPEIMSVYDMVQRIAAFFELSTETLSRTDSSSLNQRAKRPPSTGLVIAKARKELGYAPHKLEEGLAIVQEQMQIIGEG